MRIIDRYLHDRSVVHTVNTWAADFEGWSCVTPTSAAGEEYGYLSACRDLSGSEIRVTKEQPAGAAPLGAECSAPVVAADMGQPLNIERCYGDWAYVSAGESGTAQALIRRVDGTWKGYTSFPTAICWPEAVADGVPMPELHGFRC